MELTNKVILITGASSGIGRAVAIALSRMNNKLVIMARRTELLQDVAQHIRQNGSEVLALQGDALEEEQAAWIVRETVKEFGRVDIALLNVGSGPPLNTANASPNEIKQNMRVNYDTMINFFCPVIQQMKTQSEGGILAHTNSLAGFLGLPMQGQYSAAKAACRIFLDTARIELKPFRIKMLTLCPGFVNTEKNKEDGIPKPFAMSEEQSAAHILKALRLEINQYLFPTSLKISTLMGRVLPQFVTSKILSHFLPSKY